jgi:hypothetical protein
VLHAVLEHAADRSLLVQGTTAGRARALCRYRSILAPAAGGHISRMVSCPCRVRPRVPP